MPGLEFVEPASVRCLAASGGVVGGKSGGIAISGGEGAFGEIYGNGNGLMAGVGLGTGGGVTGGLSYGFPIRQHSNPKVHPKPVVLKSHSN